MVPLVPYLAIAQVTLKVSAEVRYDDGNLSMEWQYRYRETAQPLHTSSRFALHSYFSSKLFDHACSLCKMFANSLFYLHS